MLQAVGRTPKGKKIAADKALHETHVAAEVIAGELHGTKELTSAAFNARVIPSVAYTDPEVAWVGLTEDQAKAQGIKVKKGLFPWTASGRAIANGRDEGVTKLLLDDSHAPDAGREHWGAWQLHRFAACAEADAPLKMPCKRKALHERGILLRRRGAIYWRARWK